MKERKGERKKDWKGKKDCQKKKNPMLLEGDMVEERKGRGPERLLVDKAQNLVLRPCVHDYNVQKPLVLFFKPNGL